MTLVVTLKKGLNDDEIGTIVDFALKQPCVRGVTFQPIQAAGRLEQYDPATDRLVQLFPFQFWDETAMVVGIVVIAASLAIAVVAGRRARRSDATRPAAELTTAPEPGT